MNRRAFFVPSAVLRPSTPWARLLSIAIALVVLASTVAPVTASTPVTTGYRDHAYGGGAARPAGDKPQSKVWFTDGQWFAGMFVWRQTAPTRSQFNIWRLDLASQDWIDTGVAVDTRDDTHGDYLWHQAGQTLWVASAPQVPSTIPTTAVDDAIKVFKYTYNPTTNVYSPAAGFPVAIPATASVPNVSSGGAPSVSIARDSTGRLWTTWIKGTEVRFSTSSDGGATWSTPAKVPVQGSNSVRSVNNVNTDTSAVINFGSRVGIGWSDHDGLPTVGDDGYYFAVIDAGDDPTNAGNWALEDLPSLVLTEQADNHLNLKAASDGTVYAVGKTGKDTANNCATNTTQPLITAFRRSTGGTWTAHRVANVGSCNTRPQIVLSEEVNRAYVFMTAPNGGGNIYVKSAPLTGADALEFTQPASLFIDSATETLIDDPSTPRQLVTSASGIAVIANNLSSSGSTGPKVYLHNTMTIGDGPPPTDTTPPTSPGRPVHRMQGVASTGIPMRLTWSPGTDGGSGVGSYFVQRSLDGTAWTRVATVTGTTVNVQLQPNHTYRFRVKTVDKAGNVSLASPGPTFHTYRYSERSRFIRYSGTWGLTGISSTWFDGRAKYSNTAGASASFTFTGTQIGWLARRGPTSGVASVFIDGSLAATVNLNSATAENKRMVFSRTFATSSTHTIRIVVAGTAGHPQVAIDELFVFR